ncbi:MAG: NAD(P)-dependent oxidoreductase, partial [Planctomycetota bacterium]
MAWHTENAGASRRVVVTKDLPGSRWKDVLTSAGCEVYYSDSNSVHTIEEIQDAIGDRCDGAIGQLNEPWRAELFESLRAAGGTAYSNFAVGYDNVSVDEATSRGIAVGNTPGVLTETTAELAVALTYAAARRVSESEVFLREGKFKAWLPDLFLGKLLWGGTLGLIGAGRIGSRYAKMLVQASSMDVVYWSRSQNAELEDYFARYSDFAEATGERRVSCRRVEDLSELLAVSDVAAVHVPLSDATRHLIDAERLAQMKDDAILINTSRGPTVHEAALVERLKAFPNFRAGLDVFEREPAIEPGLDQLPNAVLVPHIG